MSFEPPRGLKGSTTHGDDNDRVKNPNLITD
jgi:hypothetical protein